MPARNWEGAGRTEVLLAYQSHARISDGLDHFRRSIRGAIVHDEDFHRPGVVRGQHGANGAGYDLFLVEGGNQNGDRLTRIWSFVAF